MDLSPNAVATTSVAGGRVIRLTTGTTSSGRNMAMAPATGINGLPHRKNSATAVPTPDIMPAYAPAFVVRRQNSPYKYGARKAPASAPHAITIRFTITSTLLTAISSDNITNTAHNTRIRIMVDLDFFSRSPNAP